MFKLPGTNMVLGTAVFGPENVREFGQKPGSGASLGYGPAWVLHCTGSTWNPVTVPATPVWASPVSATDIWVLGPSAASVSKPTQVIVAVRWNGSSWRTLRLPKLTAVDGHPWVPDGIAALETKGRCLRASPRGRGRYRALGAARVGAMVLESNGLGQKIWRARASPGKTTGAPG